MPFSTTYSRTKTFANGGTLLPADLNNIQDDLGNQIAVANVAGGFNEGSNNRRGKSIIATEETYSSSTYGLMTTPDRVSSVVLPTDGLICVAYQANWKSSVLSAGSAAVFIASSELVIAGSGTSPSNSGAFAVSPSTADTYRPLVTIGTGLRTVSAAGSAYTNDVTTGQINGDSTAGLSGPLFIFAAAGTYDISVQFKASSGTATAKNRKLWVWTLGF